MPVQYIAKMLINILDFSDAILLFLILLYYLRLFRHVIWLFNQAVNKKILPERCKFSKKFSATIDDIFPGIFSSHLEVAGIVF